MTEVTDSRAISPSGFGPLAGDHHDDDGQANDDILVAAEHGPVEYGTFLAASELDSLTRPTRVISREVVFNPGSDPVMVFPADVTRVGLQIQWSGGADSVVRFASDKSESLFAAPLRQATASPIPFTFDSHTGAVWIHVVGTESTSVGVTVVAS